MTVRDPDVSLEELQQIMAFAWSQWKKEIHVSMAGVVVAYDADTARAKVRIAQDAMLDDGTALPRPVLMDLPVLHAAGGGFVLHTPLAAGDPVHILFSERSLSQFKQTLQAGPLADTTIMDMSDASVIPGYVPLTFTPVDGLAMQTTDGESYVSVQDGEVVLQSDLVTTQSATGDSFISVDNGEVIIHADRVTIQYRGGSVSYP